MTKQSKVKRSAASGRSGREAGTEAERSKAVPSSDVAVGGDPSRRAATHLIPEGKRRPGAEAFDRSRQLANVPVNETPPPQVLDPEGYQKRAAARQEESRKAARKRNEGLAKAARAGDAVGSAGTVPPRAAQTSRDRAIQAGEPYDNSQAGDFRDSSQKKGKAPEERYLRSGKTHPEVAPGKTAQQADDVQKGKVGTEE